MQATQPHKATEQRERAERMKINLHPSFKATFQVWTLLALGILTASILATFLTIVGVSANISLSVAFFFLIGISIIGFIKVPQSFLTIKSGIEIQTLGLRQLRLAAVVLVIIGSILWILSIVGIVEGSWISILAGAFTILGVVLTLFPFQDTSTPPTLLIDNTTLGIDKDKGVLIVFTKKTLRGETIFLSQGFFDEPDNKASSAASVIGRKSEKGTAYVAVFPQLEPGNYTVRTSSKEYVAKITVHPKLVAEIDWR